MPQNQERKQNDFSQYDALSSEKLSEILRLDSEMPEECGLDIDTLLYITGLLAERKKIGKSSEEAWHSFEQNYLDSKVIPSQVSSVPHSAKPWIRRMIAAVAAVLLVISVPLTVQALGWEEIRTAVLQWANEAFSFVTGGQSNLHKPTTTDDRTFTSMQEIFDAQGFTAIPTWIPDGYTLLSIKITDTPEKSTYVAHYSQNDKYFHYTVIFHAMQNPTFVEANEDIVEIYTVDAQEYYIISNNDRLGVIWLNGSYECYISGDLTIDEIKQMINSIPKE